MYTLHHLVNILNSKEMNLRHVSGKLVMVLVVFGVRGQGEDSNNN